MHILPAGSCTPDSVYRTRANVDVWVFPSYMDLHSTQYHGLVTGAQCGRAEDDGAFTGDISMQMIADQRYHAVICGHSERRRYHNETDEMIARQVAAALRTGLIPILCAGETADQHDRGEAEDIVRKQISSVRMDPAVIIAYEPVWAIGTGKTPNPSDVEKMHLFIRSLLPAPEKMRIIYGGSVNGKNAASFFAQPNIDGALVGGSSLKPDEFRSIVEAA